MSFDVAFGLFCVALIGVIFGPGIVTHLRWRRERRARGM